MADVAINRYWCHICWQVVDPVMAMELKCPICDSGFVEEIEGREVPGTESIRSDSALSPWAFILLGMMANPSHRHRSQRNPRIEDYDDSDQEQEHEFIAPRRRRELEEDEWVTERELQSIVRRRTRIVRLLQSLREDFRSVADELEREDEAEGASESEIMAPTNPYRAIILQGSFDSDQNQLGASIGDYFIGSGLELLLQHLAENDLNRYGTPPAKKEAVNVLPFVKIDDKNNCPVCLEVLEFGSEAREMPCKHKFHNECILPWLELHSSCPVCRFQLPADESKDSIGSEGFYSDGTVRRRNRSRPSASQPISSVLFSFPGSQSDVNSSSNLNTSTSSSDHNSPVDEN